MRPRALVWAVLSFAFVSCVTIAAGWDRMRQGIPPEWRLQLNALRYGFTINHDIRIAMSDGTRLAGSLYLPRDARATRGTVLIQQPYSRRTYPEGLSGADFFARNGFAVLVQDIRGKFDSEGAFTPYQNGTRDAAETLDWISRQPWSNGRVGMWGCSGLGELQFVASRSRHPGLVAITPLGAGGALGRMGGKIGYFGLFEGGIFQLASGAGWFGRHGGRGETSGGALITEQLATLPSSRVLPTDTQGGATFAKFVRAQFQDPWWRTLDHVSDGDRLQTPALTITTWGDQTLGESLQLARELQRVNPQHNKVVLAPGAHCDHAGATQGEHIQFGDLSVRNAARPFFDWYLRWFRFWLHGEGDGLAELPPYQYFMLGEDAWHSSQQWPPESSTSQRWYLVGGQANSREGNGALTMAPTPKVGVDQFQYDPMHPVPSLGGPLCCTGNASDRAGPVDQSTVETRNDVLVYTTPPLTSDLRIAGPLFATLHISSSALDTDFVARLTHVRQDGTSLNIQEGALRARYRDGFDAEKWLTPNEVVALKIDMRSIAYRVPKGDRLRLQVTSSAFPRLERNLNVGGVNAEATTPIIATNSVHFGPDHASYIELFALTQ